MLVTFWGTRGSIAKAGPTTVRYGGNTSCVELRSAAGTLVILDCGTGLHGLGQKLMGGGKAPLRGHILIGHTHWDHIQGFPFFAPLFVPGNEWDVYAPRGFGESLREALSGQMQYTYFPVGLEQLGATIRYHDLMEGHFAVGELTVHAQYLNHPALTLGYRVEGEGATVVYACDHEPHGRELSSGAGAIGIQDRRHADFLHGADLVIHDAQYTPQEYKTKVGWGHSTPEYAIALCERAGVRRLALTHHDPMRTDADVDRLLAGLRDVIQASGVEVFAAAEGTTIELGVSTGQQRRPRAEVSNAEVPAALLEHKVVLVSGHQATIEQFSSAAAGDRIPVSVAGSAAAALATVRAQRPSLAVLDHDLLGAATADTARQMRDAGLAQDGPLIVVAGHDMPLPDGASETLIRPFSQEYARTRMRAWLMRTTSRWMKAATPKREAERLATLHALNVLDSQPEERFDRITRVAAAAFDVPMVLVTLVDRERQWFKSCVGLDDRETHRDASFCAHAILGTDILVVPDALRDDRFADNPKVTGDPRVRFYAGAPIRVGDAGPIGTLCIIDTRPRDLDAAQLALLRSLADMVEREIALDPWGRNR